MKCLVLGAGKMVEAILVGLASTEALTEWGIYSPSGVSAKALAEKVGAQFVPDLGAVDPDWVLVGCKPQQLKLLAQNLDGKFKNALYLSLLAAIEEGVQRQILGVSRLIRVMPNLSVKYGEGVTLLSSTSAVNQLPEIEKLFGKIGIAKIMPEAALTELTLLTGSGPALFYEFTLNLAQSFSSLSEGEREALARQVLLGAGLSAKNEVTPLPQMIDAVTSKGGVTIAVLAEFRNKNLIGVLREGVRAGLLRTQELMKLILQS